MKQNLLRAAIVRNEMTQAEVARKLGITEKTFSLKMRSGIFKTTEAKQMVDMLHIENPAEVFFED